MAVAAILDFGFLAILWSLMKISA